MKALLIILGIILFFILLLSIPVLVDIEYTDAFRLSIQWLFVKLKIFPQKEKKKKEKEKKEKPEEEKKEDGEEKKEEKEEKPKPKKENPFVTFYHNQGVSGIIQLVKDCCAALGKFSKGFIRSFYIRKLRIYMSITEKDAAATAIKYGKVCSEIYPPLGFICSSCHVKDPQVHIYADYIGEKTVGEFETRIAIIPRRIVNAGIALVFRLGLQLLKLVFSNIKYANKPKANSVNTNSVKKGGQTQ